MDSETFSIFCNVVLCSCSAYGTINKEELKKLVKQEKITYILYEEGMEYEQQYCREETIASVYKLVYETEDGRIRIYET